MAFDGLFTRAMTKELSHQLIGGRINKIHQPDKQEIVIAIRANGKNAKLLLSAHPSFARIQITGETFVNPNEPPMFCMLLRKHLEGAVIEDIRQEGIDRIIIMDLKGRDELGDVSYKQLMIEIMGRYSNIILVDKANQTIIDSVKHIPHALNSFRTILPGSAYISPPAQEKIDPFEADENDVLRTIDFLGGKLDKQLVSQFAGLSPLAAKEIVFQAGLANRGTLPSAFTNFMNLVKGGDFEPSMMEVGGKEYFYFFPLHHLKGAQKRYSSLSELLDRFYYGKAVRDRVKQQANDLERFIKNEKEKNETKLIKLENTLEDAENGDKLQLLGELLTANMHLVKKGMTEITVDNYYDEAGGTVTIPLSSRKTPSENAQNYYSKYQKSKNAIIKVNQQIEITKEEISYFDALLQQLTSASTSDIEEIREELVEGGYMKARQRKGPRKNQNKKPVLEQYLAHDGTEILVGKNNKQNDYLTMKLARRDEVWLHTKDIPGSHVVIRSENPSEETIELAAQLAAYFSKAKNSASVPVDFTKIRHVKKPNGSKPGFVIYDNQQTVFVTPDEEVVRELKSKF